ncbi:hypothetical protein [Kitasatospora sp. NPDC093806]|uniref:hypothetical protein n=1 Tax=Kitasatospora sp. NPDC093806 TaxID=3155075 RepID=UPI0034283962
MAPRPPARPRPARPASAALLAPAAVLAVLAAALLSGCASSGGLSDHGPAAPVTPSPKPQPLWPDLAAAPAPTPPASASGRAPEASPQPVPEVTAPGQDITAVDVRALLAKDPDTSPDERRALDSCPGTPAAPAAPGTPTACALRAPEFRDLTGDGRPELITALGTAGSAGPVVLHVYTLSGDRLIPVLRVPLLNAFSAETVGTDLWLHESTGVWARTSSHYGWDGVRLGLLERKAQDVGPLPGPSQTPTADPEAPAAPTAKPSAGRPSVSPEPARPKTGASPVAPPAPGAPVLPAAPGRTAAPTATPVPQPVRPTAVPPETTP